MEGTIVCCACLSRELLCLCSEHHVVTCLACSFVLCRYRKKLQTARQKGLKPPPLPDGVDADIVTLFEEVIGELTQKVGDQSTCHRSGLLCVLGIIWGWPGFQWAHSLTLPAAVVCT